jgi:hypothetical protein
VLRSGQRWRVEEWTTTALRVMETAMAMATVTKLREGWQRKNVGLQKPKGLGERRTERENTMDFFFFFWGSTQVFSRVFFLILF